MLQAALAARDRRPALGLRAVPAAAAGGRRYGVVAGVGRALDAIEAVPVRRRGARRCARGRGRRADPRLAGRLPVHRRHLGVRRGRGLLPATPRSLVVESTFAEAVLLETLLLSIYNHDSRDRVGRVPDDVRRRRPAVHRDGLAAHPRGGRGRVRPGGVRRRLRVVVQPRRPPALRRPDRRHQRAQLHAAARHRGRRVPRAGRRRSARARPCWSTPTTSPRRCGSASRSPGRGSARSGSTPATSARSPTQVRDQLDGLGATDTRIVVTSDLDEHAIAALAAAPVDGYGVGTQLVTGSGHPTCGFVYKLVAREGAGGAMVSVAKRSADKGSVGGRKFALRRRDAAASPRPRSSASATPPVDDGDDRPLLVPAGARRRGRRPGAARGRPGAPPRVPRRAAAARPRSCAAASPVIETRTSTAERLMALLHRRLLLRVPRGRDLADRGAAAGDRGADRRRAVGGREPAGRRPLPAPRPLRRPHRRGCATPASSGTRRPPGSPW